MKKRISLLVYCFLIIMISGSGFVYAHGTGYRIIEQNQTVALECYYSDGTAMDYSEVSLFSPAEKELEYQNGRTDRNGRFAFLPDTHGIWNIIVNDGMGHKIQAEVNVGLHSGADPEGEKPLFNKKSNSMKICLGISLIFNLCFMVLLTKKGFRSD